MAQLEISMRVYGVRRIVRIDTDAVPEHVFRRALTLGFHSLLNRGRLRLGPSPSSEALSKLIDENLHRINSGEIAPSPHR